MPKERDRSEQNSKGSQPSRRSPSDTPATVSEQHDPLSAQNTTQGPVSGSPSSCTRSLVWLVPQTGSPDTAEKVPYSARKPVKSVPPGMVKVFSSGSRIHPGPETPGHAPSPVPIVGLLDFSQSETLSSAPTSSIASSSQGPASLTNFSTASPSTTFPPTPSSGSFGAFVSPAGSPHTTEGSHYAPPYPEMQDPGSCVNHYNGLEQPGPIAPYSQHTDWASTGHPIQGNSPLLGGHPLTGSPSAEMPQMSVDMGPNLGSTITGGAPGNSLQFFPGPQDDHWTDFMSTAHSVPGDNFQVPGSPIGGTVPGTQSQAFIDPYFLQPTPNAETSTHVPQNNFEEDWQHDDELFDRSGRE